jgi:prevent-host-death family protein
MAVTVGIRELRNNLRAYLDRVKNGEEVTITERGKVIARLNSVSAERKALEELAAAGLLTRAKMPKTPLREEDLIPVRGSVSDIVIEQRRSGY